MKFAELQLTERIVRAVAAEGYTTPTPIQAKAIPVILSGRDVLGCAQTGTGKTGAFALPILHRLAESMPEQPSNESENTPTDTSPREPKSGWRKGRRRRRGKDYASTNVPVPRGRNPRALIICPTRELATQIFESFKTYGRKLPLRHAVVFGGVSQHRQVRDIHAGIDVLVATPGRLLDLMNQGVVDLSEIEIFVLDEADTMMDMGFIHDIKKIVARTPERRQTLMFSATMPPEIRTLADSLLQKPAFIEVAPVATTAEAVTQSVYYVAKQNKPELLERVLSDDSVGRALVFSRTKHGADKLVKQLNRAGLASTAIHSNKSQNARTKALQAFKTGKTLILIATDIASRGIDVDEITHVINFDLPDVPETYVHRIGRTARAGASGVAVTFCDVAEVSDLRRIERLTGEKLDVNEDEVDLTFDIRNAPKGDGQRNGRRKSGGNRDNRGRHKSRNSSNNSKHSGRKRSTGRKGAGAAKNATK